MTIKYKINNQKKCICAKCVDVLTLDDFDYYHNVFWCNPEIFGFNELFDLREADVSQLHYSDVQKVAENATRVEGIDTHAKLAIVLNPGMQEQLVSYYQSAKILINKPTRSILAFHSKDKAVEWLMHN